MKAGVAVTWLTSEPKPVKTWLDSTPLEVKYVRSLYWGLSTLTVVDYGDVTAKSNNEIYVFILTMTIGFFTVAGVIGTMGNLMTSFDTKAVEHQQKIDVFMNFAAKQELPLELKAKALKYFDYKWKLSKGQGSR